LTEAHGDEQAADVVVEQLVKTGPSPLHLTVNSLFVHPGSLAERTAPDQSISRIRSGG
jgi:hypothetical protein